MAAKTLVWQSSFNRGELDPALAGRADWEGYPGGAKTVRNLVIRPQGGVRKRGGTEFVAYALEQEKPSRLIPFRFSAGQEYLLEFGDCRFRVLKDGGVVSYPAGHAQAGQPALLSSPYPAGDLAGLTVAQAADLMIFAHPNYPPQRLVRYDHHDWRFSPLVPVNRGDGPLATLSQSGGNRRRYVVTAVAAGDETSPSATLTALNPNVINPPDSAQSFSSQYNWLKSRGGQLPARLNFYAMGQTELLSFLISCGYATVYPGIIRPDGTNYVWYHTWPGGAGTRTITWNPANLTPLINECLAACDRGWDPNALAELRQWIDAYVGSYNNSLPVSNLNQLQWPALAGASQYHVYRAPAEGGSFMRLGSTTTLSFTDNNLPDPEGAETLPTTESPFAGPGDYPGVCLFHQQRLILARSDNKPNTVWGSRLGNYREFILPAGEELSDASPFEFALYGAEAINWGVSMHGILFGTAGGEYRMSGGAEALSALNVSALRQSNHGCGVLPPVMVGDALLGVGRLGRSLRAYKWDYGNDAYQGASVSHYAGHLFRRREIVGLAYQAEPEALLWTVMSDGALLSCAYLPEEEVLGWSRHDTDGRFEGLAAMEGPEREPELWLLAAREIGGQVRRLLERLRRPQEEGEEIHNAWHLDAGLSRDGPPAAVLSGLEHLEGRAVACLADGNVYENLTVAGGSVTLPEPAGKAIVGLPYRAELETLELEPADGSRLGHLARRPVMVSVLFSHSRDCRYGWPEKSWAVEFWADSEARPLPPFNGRRTLSLPAPPEGRAGTVWLASDLPLPFGVLALTAGLTVGEMAPNPGGRR
ncbi:MAG: hypothetical protein LBV15_02720 [Planctomycetota bacterium]|jgi:hypothetical protein|nr:hypothetical protein [Planctomycetota bacterium]